MTPDRYSKTSTGSRTVTYDAGLRAHMQRVYNRMTLGVMVTAVVSFFVSGNQALLQLFLGGPQMYLVIFAPLLVLWFGFNPKTMSSDKLKISFLLISVLYGISFSVIFLVFTKASIARAFFMATGMFAGLSIFGYTTKKDLSALGTFAVMGVFGVFILSIINMFAGHSGMADLIAGVGIIAFAGLTAWETQSIKEMYSPSNGEEANSRMAWSAALSLYINFIAMFQYILRLTGGRN